MRILYDPLYLEHDTGHHPECPDRLRAIVDHLQEGPFAENLRIGKSDRVASDDDLALVHTDDHVAKVGRICAAGGGPLDPDTRACAASDRISRHAIGTLLDAVEAPLATGGDRQLLVVSRPPGHHATRTRSMGFCLYNHVAVAARHLRERKGLSRVLILDFDAHHGNGTQDIFYDDPSVGYLSIHRAPPFYPGTGAADETGTGAGEGATFNHPIEGPPFPVDAAALFLEKTGEAIDAFGPDLILVSAGFDGYRYDPLAGLRMEVDDFRRIGTGLRDLAEKACDGRVVSVLEGGYHLEGLPLCVGAYLEGLAGT